MKFPTAMATNLREWRSALHERAELAWSEFRTQAYVTAQLVALGLQPRSIGGTGVVADIAFADAGPCIAFRADMDALPFPAADGTVVAQHACGHDMHTAMLLGLADFLLQNRAQFRGTVRLIFQPAEEVLALDSGARRLIDAGVLTNPTVSRIYALHVSPRFALGTAAYRSGTLMAESRRITLCVAGQGGHGAVQNVLTDPILAIAKLLANLAEQASNDVPTQGSATFCRIQGGSAPNVRPLAVRAEGTVRAGSAGAAGHCEECLRQRIALFAQNYPQLSFTLEGTPAYPLLINNAELDMLVSSALSEALGAENLMHTEPSMASEDFGAYLTHCLGAMFFLGTKDPSMPDQAGLHCVGFRASDDALEVGVRCFAAIAAHELGIQRGGNA